MNILCPNANWTSAIMSEKVTVIRTEAASSARPVYRHPRRWTDGHVLDASVYDTCCTSRNNRIPATATIIIIIIMDKMQSGWFSELTDLLPGRSFSMEVEQVLHKERSEYQDILVLKTKSHGVVLVLDGMVQCTEFDEFAYQEMISFLPLFSHPKPQRVLIVGGGDGGVAREVAKHPLVETIDQVEIDDRVVKLSKQYLPFMAEGFNSPKLTLHIADGFKFMEDHVQYYDVIITDSSDPIGPAISLFQKSYFELMKQALRPGGIVCSQADTFWGHLKNATSMRNHCKEVFAKAAYATSYVSTYPAGQIGYALGSLNENTDFANPVCQLTNQQRKDMKLRYYTTDVHKAAFALPAFVVDALDDANDS